MDAPVVWVAIGALSGLAVAIGVFITFWINVGSQNANALALAKSAQDDAAAAIKKYDDLQREVNDHRTLMAGDIAALDALVKATSQALFSAEHRLVKALDDLGARFDLFAQRMDRLFEARIHGP